MIYKSFKTVFGIAAICLFSLNACNNAKSEQNGKVEKVNVQNASFLNVSSSNSNSSSVKADLEKAKKDKKTVFLVVTGTDVKTENINKIAADASKKVKNSIVLQMNRDDIANADLVKDFRLTGAPLPLVLIVANNGLLTGGMVEKDATVENLVNAVPSPKYLEVMTALSEGKSVFIVAYKKNAKDVKQANINCMKACSDVKTAVTVEVDLNDNAETNLIKQLQIDENQEMTTLVVNPQGQITGIYTGIPDVNKLVTDAKKVIKSSCCPGNNKSNCK